MTVPRLRSGGKGAYRIADRLDVAAARADPKPLVGFSDIMYRHLALHRAGVPGSVHGPVPMGTRTTIDPAAGRMTVSSGVR